VVKRFLDFTRPMDIRLEATQLAELLKEVLEVARPQLQESQHPTGAVAADRCAGSVRGSRAAQAGRAESGAECRGSHAHRRTIAAGAEPPRQMAEISVGDTGKGIAPENRQKFFNYFSPRVREAAESGLRVRFELCSFTMVR